MPGPQPGDTLVAAALKVMFEPDPWLKAAYTKEAVSLWQSGAISRVCDGPLDPSQVPDRPNRQCDKVKLVAPGAMPKLGKGGTLASRQAILHSLVHIELAAVDLSWDIIVRFGTDPAYKLPKSFFDDFVQVAADEASHFSMLNQRLEAVGSHYGALPAHDGLWESAQTTAHSLPARLAVEHCVHEARGLDVLPSTVQKFRGNGDAESAALLEDVIYAEEISHCAAGVRWLKYLHQLAQGTLQTPTQQQQQPAGGMHMPHADDILNGSIPQPAAAANGSAACCTAAPSAATAAVQNGAVEGSTGSDGTTVADWVTDALQFSSVESWFHALIRRHFKGSLKPPFNEAARAQAGFGPEWYMPLAAGPTVPPQPKAAAAHAAASVAVQANAAAVAPAVTESIPAAAAAAALQSVTL